MIGSNKIEIKFPNDYPESLEDVVKYYRANLKVTNSKSLQASEITSISQALLDKWQKGGSVQEMWCRGEKNIPWKLFK